MVVSMKCGCREPNLNSLQNHQVFFMAKPTLQSLNVFTTFRWSENKTYMYNVYIKTIYVQRCKVKVRKEQGALGKSVRR